MSESTTLTEELTKTSAVADPTVSDDAQTPVSETPKGAQEQVESAAELVEAIQESTERSIPDLEALASDPNATLTVAELNRLSSHNQGLRDRANLVTLRQQNAARAEENAAEEYNRVLAQVQEQGLEGELAAQLLNPVATKVRTAIGQLHVAELDVEVTRAIAELKDGGSLAAQAEASQLPLSQKLQALIPLVYEAGRKAGPPEGYVVMTKAEFEAEKKAAANEVKVSVKANQSGEARSSTSTYTTKLQARELHALPEGDPKKISNAEMRRILASALPER